MRVLTDTQGIMDVAGCVRPSAWGRPEDMCKSP